MFFRWKDSIFEVTRKFSFLIQVCNVKEEEKCTAELNQPHLQDKVNLIKETEIIKAKNMQEAQKKVSEKILRVCAEMKTS